MSCSAGECFVVLPTAGTEKCLIVGRNALGENEVGVAQEVYFHEAAEALEGKSDGGVELNTPENSFALILQKPRPGVWGADYAANEHNLVITITWAETPDEGDGDVQPTDIIRIVLASKATAEAAIDYIGDLVADHAGKSFKANFLICDAQEAWLMSCASKFWVAEKLHRTFQRIPSNGLTVTTSFDKSSASLKETLVNAELWNGTGDLNFASCFNSVAESKEWNGPELIGDSNFGLVNMFEVLRCAVAPNTARSACVSVLNDNGMSHHWFTATPNAAESVFKPFVFSPHPKISPLTMTSGGSDVTLLHKLHAQRKPSALEDLKALEASCVAEVNTYVAEHSTPDEELDELMKDCVEAEVKFYR